MSLLPFALDAAGLPGRSVLRCRGDFPVSCTEGFNGHCYDADAHTADLRYSGQQSLLHVAATPSSQQQRSPYTCISKDDAIRRRRRLPGDANVKAVSTILGRLTGITTAFLAQQPTNRRGFQLLTTARSEKRWSNDAQKPVRSAGKDKSARKGKEPFDMIVVTESSTV